MSHVPPYDNKTVRERVQFQEYYDPFWQTVHNGAVRMSTVQRDLQQGDYFFGVRVPEGRRLVCYMRTLKLTEGLFTVDEIFPSDGFSGGSLATKSNLNPDAPDTVGSDLYYGVTPEGTLTVKDEGFVDTGTGVGAARTRGATGIDDIITLIPEDCVIRINSEGSDPYTAALRIVAWEEDRP